jgi:hypothetical protein
MSLPQEEGTAFRSVGHHAVSPLLAVLLTGIGVSFLVLVVERKIGHPVQCPAEPAAVLTARNV